MGSVCTDVIKWAGTTPGSPQPPMLHDAFSLHKIQSQLGGLGPRQPHNPLTCRVEWTAQGDAAPELIGYGPGPVCQASCAAARAPGQGTGSCRKTARLHACCCEMNTSLWHSRCSCKRLMRVPEELLHLVWLRAGRSSPAAVTDQTSSSAAPTCIAGSSCSCRCPVLHVPCIPGLDAST